MDVEQVTNVIEAALLSSAQPLGLSDLRQLFDDELDAVAVREVLEAIDRRWQGRGVQLVALAGGWRFQTTAEVAPFLARLHIERAPRYSRAVMETLAIIAYRQPVTRGDIEEIRGVTVSSQVIKTLEDRGWIETIGHKDVIGRPALLATTRQFLDDLGLASLDALPSLADAGPDSAAAVAALEAAGLTVADAGLTPVLPFGEAAAEVVSVAPAPEGAVLPEAREPDEDNKDLHEDDPLGS